MSVTPIEQVSSDRISSVISRLPFAKRARAVRPNDNPHPSLVALPAKAGIPLRADHDRRARSTERIEALARYSKKESRLPAFARMTMRSEEHTSELQSLMRISYAVFCLTNKKLKPDAQNPLPLSQI